MSEREVKEFQKIVSSYDKNHLDLFDYSWYEVLGLPFYGNYEASKYDERNLFIKRELTKDRDLLNMATACLNAAKSVLTNEGKKKK